jgi:hypothetical protein
LPAAEVPVEVNSKSGGMTGTAFLLDGEFAGYLGDVVHLPQGKHKVSFQGNYKYWLEMDFDVTDTVRVVKNEAHRWSSCIDRHVDKHTVKNWPPPEVRKVQAAGMTWWTVVFREPEYAGSIDAQSGCDEDASILTLKTLGSVTLNLSSVPPGAAIFIQGKERGITDKALVVPFLEREAKIRVVLRKKGYVNCAKEIPLPSVGVEKVSCSLVAVPKKP